MKKSTLVENTSSEPLNELRRLIRLIDACDAAVSALEADRSKWLGERQQTLSSGAVRDERKVSLVGVLDTKISMVPFAVTREHENQAALIESASALAGPLQSRAEKLMDELRAELIETVYANLVLLGVSEDLLDQTAEVVFGSTPLGLRIGEAAIYRESGPFRTASGVRQLLGWCDGVEKIRLDWIASKARADAVPNHEAA